MMGVPLDFEPGTQQAYSNFGYCVLGRIVETTLATKTNKRISYEEFVRSAVLKPAGISDMRIGGTRLAERARREVRDTITRKTSLNYHFWPPRSAQVKKTFHGPTADTTSARWIPTVGGLDRRRI
jgi:CubicO group peptidase (beta-lactamase class C family)